MNGGHPVSWDSTWDELAWRHPRPHRPTPSHPQVVEVVNKPYVQIQDVAEQQPIALQNGLTSRNNPKQAKKRALVARDCKATAASLPRHANQVDIGQLVFVSVDLESAEGELAIGLARAMQSCESGECKLMWFVRKEWCKQPRRHEWSKSPTFRVAADPNNPSRPYMTKEHLRKVLPVRVSLTKTSKPNFPRLDASCVRMLRELCAQRGLSVPSPSNISPPHNDDSSEDDVGAPTEHTSSREQVVDEQRISSRLMSRKRACRRHHVICDNSSDTSE